MISASPVRRNAIISLTALRLRGFRLFGVKSKREKCEFLQPDERYLGHIVCSEDLRRKNSKLEAMRSAPRPENRKHLGSFLGLVQYDGRYLSYLALIKGSLIDLSENYIEFTLSAQ